MDLYEAMRCAPTTRHFLPDPVPREALVRALENARFAPSGGNRQGWRVVVVEDPSSRAARRDLHPPRARAPAPDLSLARGRPSMEATGGARMLAEPAGLDPKRVRMVQRANEYAERLAEVPGHPLGGVRRGGVV